MNSGWSERLVLSFAPGLAAILIRGLYRLMRIEFLGTEHPRQLVATGQPAIYAFWHDQLFLMAKGYLGSRDVKILISASRDGELIARTMGHFGFEAVRGSSNRGAAQAVKEMLRIARSGSSLAITPDGPKGPRHIPKAGVIEVARRTGLPVVPFSFACSHGHRFASWDRFLVPFPWGRGVYVYGEPLFAEEDESTEAFRQRLEDAMTGNAVLAAERLKTYGLFPV